MIQHILIQQRIIEALLWPRHCAQARGYGDEIRILRELRISFNLQVWMK